MKKAKCRNPVLALALILTIIWERKHMKTTMSQSSISPGAYSDNQDWQLSNTMV